MMLSPSCSTADDAKLYGDPHLDESLAHHGVLAQMAEEALVVPGQGLEGHKLGASQATLAWQKIK